ncbi:hypothetical protein F5I97DRAFT_861847 [Phlebopus sp. FC_14]|nr:hypothetical protein F5I97DRAFT_861847 [Phlebopus sp. FC_14]
MMSVRLNHPSPPPIATIEGTQSLDSDSEDQCSLMQISRFAYQPPASVRLTLDTPLQHIKSNIGICEPGPSGRIDPVQSSVTVKHVLDEFSDPQLANLSKCVGCGLQWTSRKTAKQKRLHIEKCTKKNALASDTVRSLVGKEVQKSNSSKDSGASHDENMASSLLDSVIPERTAQKAKRQQVLSTIKPLPETRASILGRAKDVLGRTRGLKADGPGPDMQATQRFGTSLLARRNSGNAFLDTQEGEPVAVTPAVTRAFNVSAVDGKELSTRATEKHPWPPFPQTQEFGGSKLAQRSNSTSSAPTSYKRSPSLGTEHDRPAKARLVQDVRLS